MIDFSRFDRRPIIVAIAGSNGAGKTTFYHSHLASAGLRFVNADVLADELAAEPYDAARVADDVRQTLVQRNESFVFETVFSDPAGEKLRFLEDASRRGFEVVLCFIALASAEQSIERVAMRVTQGGHDVPEEKLQARYPRTNRNLREACRRLPNVLIFDNSDLRKPYRLIATFEQGSSTILTEPIPDWLRTVIE